MALIVSGKVGTIIFTGFVIESQLNQSAFSGSGGSHTEI